MNIDRMQKLNQMASNLQRQNLYSKEESVRMASQLYGKENNFFEEKNNNESDHFRKEIRKLAFALRDAMIEIRELKEKTQYLENNLQEARTNVRQNVHIQPPQNIEVQTENQSGNQLSFSTQTVAPVKKNDPNHPIDRNNVSPSEISIEKFFYFGQK